MPTHNQPPHNPDDPHHLYVPDEDRSLGYETTDVSVQGIFVFLVALGVSVGVFFVFCFGMGKVINSALEKHDGPSNRWNAQAAPSGKLRNMESSPAMQQQQLSQLTQRFPTPRLQSDDGNQETADLHAREDLLLDHYTWVNREKGQVRIPIERAMELIAQRGLPVAASAANEPLMTADSARTVDTPLTDGFARTGYEQEQMQTQEQQRRHGVAAGEQASAAQPR
ncbi:MAG TPA: hypothetical protein VM554_11390 [Acidisarcina sp.]|nr:hypothetical protein [Acidisarcina sp.]